MNPDERTEEYSYRMLEPSESEKMAELHKDVYVLTRERAGRWYSLPYHEQVEESFGAFSGDRMIAGLSVTYYDIHLNGLKVVMGGVGGVATQPEYRHSGHVKKLLELALTRMKERGALVSGLYPFKYAFYRKYGWEHACDLLKMVIPMRSLAVQRGRWDPTAKSQFVRVEDFSSRIREMNYVYEKAMADYNLSTARSLKDWERTAERLKNTESDGKNVYVYLGFRGDEPASYLIYSFSPSGESRRLEIREAFGVDFSAYREVMDFLSCHDSQAHEVSWVLPVDTPVRSILTEPLGGELIPRLMFRVVDAESVLGLFVDSLFGNKHKPYEVNKVGDALSPKDFRSFTISLGDPCLPWNNRAFSVTPQGVKPLESGSSTCNVPDLAMDILAFSEIVSGYKSPYQCEMEGTVQVGNKNALNSLFALFPKKTTFCTDYF